MGGAGSTYWGEERVHTGVWWGSLKEKTTWEIQA